MIQAVVRDHLRGRVMSLFSLVLLGMMPLGNIMVGALAALTGTGPAVAASAAALAVTAALIIALRPEFLRDHGGTAKE